MASKPVVRFQHHQRDALHEPRRYDQAFLELAASTAVFYNLRQHGAFLVSAELTDRVVAGVEVLSEKGRICRLFNPWPGVSLRLEHPDGSAQDPGG